MAASKARSPAPWAVGGATSNGTDGVNSDTTGTITSDRIIASAPALIGLAIHGAPTKPEIMFPVVRPTPTMKLTHTLAFDTFPLYRPQRNGPKNAPASAPQLMPMSCAMNGSEPCTCTMPIAADTAMNTTSSTRIHVTCFFSDMSFTRLSLIRSSVSVDDDVSTSELSVDIEADSTMTTSTPSRMSGMFDTSAGMIESYTMAPVTGLYSMNCAAAPVSARRPKPPRKYDPPAMTSANTVEMMAPCFTAGPLLIA